MHCDTCNTPIPSGDQRDHHGKRLCEDCYMVALSPVKTCDPWAVHSAKSMAGTGLELTKPQKTILAVLRETGGIQEAELAHRVQMAPADLQREIATLRHMEKLRAVKEGDRKLFRLW